MSKTLVPSSQEIMVQKEVCMRIIYICVLVSLCEWVAWTCASQGIIMSSFPVWIPLQGVLQVKAHFFIKIELLF